MTETQAQYKTARPEWEQDYLDRLAKMTNAELLEQYSNTCIVLATGYWRSIREHQITYEVLAARLGGWLRE